MFKRTKLSAGLLLAFGGAIASTAAAQQALERVEITGSSIRRVESEGALPVQIIKREDIAKTGATSVVDLLQKLPVAQGATTESTSVGGGGAGFTGISLHNIGETRTLVLVNGRRMANFGGQALTGGLAAFDVNSLPISAIERVEILTDGASALYGSDAIAGVVNFITLRNSNAGDISVGYTDTHDGGAKEKRISLTKGFGDLDTDGFNVLFAASLDKRDPLNGVQRDVARTGVINFSQGGRRYQAFLGSASPIPANVLLDDLETIVNPYFLANGQCAPGSVLAAGTQACYFDFVAALEIYPERERKNLMVSGTAKINEDHRVFADFLVSKTESTGQIAPVPGAILIEAGSPLWNQYDLGSIPGLTGANIFGGTLALYRAADLGRRADLNEAKFRNFVVGAEGVLGAWDYKTAVTYSENKFRNDITGYPGAIAFNRLTSAGLLDPFVLPGQQSDAANEALANVAYRGYWDGGVSKLTGVDISGSRELAKLAGGPLAIGTGASFYREEYTSKPSLFAQGRLADPVAGTLCDATITDPDDPLYCDQRFGDGAETTPYGGKRNVYGLFVELNAPLAKNFETTASLRYDNYEEVGSTTNGKLSFRWTAAPNLLFRSSIGTGFKAPTVSQLKGQRQPFGVTSSPYDQTPALQAIAADLGAILRPNGTQYDVIATGNPDLEPEKSRQASIGFVFEPVPSVSLGADLWHVAIRDVFGQRPEDAVFANPNNFLDSWSTARDVGTGAVYLAFLADNQNLGKQYSTGIDFNVQSRHATPVGRWTNQLLATWMLREDQQIQPNGPYFDAIGLNSADLGIVTFKLQGRFTTSLQAGNWTHTLQANFKSGYTDSEAVVEVLGPGDTPTGVTETVQLKVKRYVSFDWQTAWQATKSINLTAGILNVLNKEPPLTLTEGGNGKGQQYGYDDRYYDVRGRTYYVNAKFAF